MDMVSGMMRSQLVIQAAENIRKDYRESLEGLSDAEQERILPQIHRRSAEILLDIARQNRGIYNKAAQLVCSNRGPVPKVSWPRIFHCFPPKTYEAHQVGDRCRGAQRRHCLLLLQEYIEVLSVLTDKAPFQSFDVMEPVLTEELKAPVSELFDSIEQTPVAAASLAQVHIGMRRLR